MLNGVHDVHDLFARLMQYTSCYLLHNLSAIFKKKEI